MEDKLYWYWLCGKVRLPIKKQKELMDIFIHPKELYKINPEILKEHMTQLEYDRFVHSGECLGLVLDLEFEIHTGKICYLIVPKTTKMLICVGKNKVYKIPYKCIVRIGRDTILVDINEKECLK